MGCGNPPVISDFYGQPCTLGQGQATQDCLDAQDNAEQRFIAAQEAYFACMGETSPESGVNPNQIVGDPSKGVTLAQVAQSIYGPNNQQAVAQSFSTPVTTPMSQITQPQSVSFPNPTVTLIANQYVSGGSFTLKIIGGAPNSVVRVASAQNGSSLPTATMGQTDSNGNFTTSGVWTDGDIGSWWEQWYVADGAANVLNFTVGKAQSQQTAAQTGSTSVVNTTNTTASTTPTSNVNAVSSGFDFSSLMSNTVDIAGMQIPEIALIGGALVLAFMFMGGRR